MYFFYFLHCIIEFSFSALQNKLFIHSWYFAGLTRSIWLKFKKKIIIIFCSSIRKKTTRIAIDNAFHRQILYLLRSFATHTNRWNVSSFYLFYFFSHKMVCCIALLKCVYYHLKKCSLKFLFNFAHSNSFNMHWALNHKPTGFDFATIYTKRMDWQFFLKKMCLNSIVRLSSFISIYRRKWLNRAIFAILKRAQQHRQAANFWMLQWGKTLRFWATMMMLVRSKSNILHTIFHRLPHKTI